ncbi:hypothetical protein J4221_00325 [Candidatus Pacearchaeota archaeon]|nr:hypothetical protein [Candidatus Pacearchaeota archaeon]
MIVDIDPMSVEDMERVLKHLPEFDPRCDFIKVELYDFSPSDILRQSRDITVKLGLDLDERVPVCYETRVIEPTKDKLLRIYRLERETRESENMKKRCQFISFKTAEWYPGELDIMLNPLSVNIICYGDIPDYIRRMREEIKGAVEYSIKLSNH